jgi:hypothetical protein
VRCTKVLNQPSEIDSDTVPMTLPLSENRARRADHWSGCEAHRPCGPFGLRASDAKGLCYYDYGPQSSNTIRDQ